jgi:hypothetical protein
MRGDQIDYAKGNYVAVLPEVLEQLLQGTV